MMKRTIFRLNLVVVLLLTGFVSCSKDSETPAYEKGNLIGDYVGNCSVSLEITISLFAPGLLPIHYKNG